ncbi:hypothetical protein PNOK_0826800 [Pyrrhoderma noxium]|uniref:Uncharacterized protein n=1 Tax=Pyrrhoderma noxium TaxID=2282107 RepID=A0A286UAP8_9AGAM|nr:hypothetical protein PNOK_0826800 [Pyrrhoderma noxium]
MLGDFTLQLKLYALYQKTMIIKTWTFIFVTDSEVNISARVAIYPSYTKMVLIPKPITEGIMLVLALRIGFKNMRQNRGIEISNSLFNLLVKDSIFYFVVIFSLYLFQQLFWSLNGPEVFETPGSVSFAIGSALSQHLLVNIRIQASKRERMETEFSLEGIRFQSGPGLDEGAHDISFGGIHSMIAVDN